MTVECSAKEAFELFNRILASELRGQRAVASIVLADRTLAPDAEPESIGSARPTFEVSAHGGASYRKVAIAPPSALVPKLLDWSPEGMEGAKSAAEACAAAYAKAVEGMGEGYFAGEPPSQQAIAAALVACVEMAGAELASGWAGTPEEGAVDEFSKACAQAQGLLPSMSNVEALAWKSALRDKAHELGAGHEKTLLAMSPIRFALRFDLIAENVELKLKEGLPARQQTALPVFGRGRGVQKTKAFQLHENGSFASRVWHQEDSGEGMARHVVENLGKMAAEHMAHRHFLKTPDGEVIGAENVKLWADAAIALRESIEIAASSKTGRPRKTPSL